MTATHYNVYRDAFSDTLMTVSAFLLAANLHDEDKVNLSHFELLTVLGTGGKVNKRLSEMETNCLTIFSLRNRLPSSKERWSR